MTPGSSQTFADTVLDTVELDRGEVVQINLLRVNCHFTIVLLFSGTLVIATLSARKRCLGLHTKNGDSNISSSSVNCSVILIFVTINKFLTIQPLLVAL